MAPRRNLVVGLGKTGLSVARWLVASGEQVAVTDSRAQPPELDALRALGSAVVTHVGGFDLDLLASADRIVLSPGVSRAEPLVRAALERGLPVVGDVELFARASAAPTVAITGTNGKSTVTTLVAEMAAAAGRRVLAGGNLGEPALDLLAQPVPELVFEFDRSVPRQPVLLEPCRRFRCGLRVNEANRCGSLGLERFRLSSSCAHISLSRPVVPRPRTVPVRQRFKAR